MLMLSILMRTLFFVMLWNEGPYKLKTNVLIKNIIRNCGKIFRKPKKNKNMCHMSIKHTKIPSSIFSVTHYFNYNTNNFQIMIIQENLFFLPLNVKHINFLTDPFSTKKKREKNPKNKSIKFSNLIKNIFSLIYEISCRICGKILRLQTKRKN